MYGFTHVEAGIINGVKGLLISVFNFLLGPVIDRLGVRYFLIFGSMILVFSRRGYSLTFLFIGIP
jgi:hypothetical protein